jgi:hypothetical protein
MPLHRIPAREFSCLPGRWKPMLLDTGICYRVLCSASRCLCDTAHSFPDPFRWNLSVLTNLNDVSDVLDENAFVTG